MKEKRWRSLQAVLMPMVCYMLFGAALGFTEAAFLPASRAFMIGMWLYGAGFASVLVLAYLTGRDVRRARKRLEETIEETVNKILGG